MCEECGCGNIEIDRSVHEDNDRAAAEIRSLLLERGIFCINVLGSPGAGKTTVIEALIKELGAGKTAVIEGDLETDVDKRRIESLGARTYQINTHSGCHLNAHMVEHALTHLDLSRIAYLMIENVGNLVCPSDVDLGQHLNLLVSSTPEGSDKPLKYPHIFRYAHMIALSKYDLCKATGFDEEAYRRAAGPKKIFPFIREDKIRAKVIAEELRRSRQDLLSKMKIDKAQHKSQA